MAGDFLRAVWAEEKNIADAGVVAEIAAPTFAYKDELFWGQDRLDFRDRAMIA